MARSAIRRLLLARSGLRLLVLFATIAGAASAVAQDLDQRPFPEKPEEAPRQPLLTKEPQLIKAAEPVYPTEALVARLSADVTMDVDLDASGRVTNVAVTTGAGHGFDEAAVVAVKASTFPTS